MADKPTDSLTLEQIEELHDETAAPCGSEQSPHIVHPQDNYRCISCGARRSVLGELLESEAP